MPLLVPPPLPPPALVAPALVEPAHGGPPSVQPPFVEPPFVETGERALPGVRTTCGSPAKDWILEVNGGGLALADFDADGDVDVVVVDGSTLERVAAGEPGFPPRLFLGNGDGTFAPAGEAWAMKGGRWGMGCAAGDLDGDGFVDLVVTEWGRDRVFLNDGGRGFRELADPGLVGERWGTSAALLDFDRDGVLDLVVVNYLAFDPAEIAPRGEGCRWKGHDVMCGPEGLVPVHDQLYRGLGDGRFEDVTVAAGFRPEHAGFGLGVTTLDYDLDGDTDVYVTNDSTPNHLWENQGDGTFVERGFERGVAYDGNGKEQAGMGIATGDADGDGRDDLFVTNFSGESNALYASSRATAFRERSSVAGLAGPSMGMLGWGTAFVDVGLDGTLDLAVFNGHVYPQADEPGTDTSYAQPDQLYRAYAAGDASRGAAGGAGREPARYAPEPLSDAPPGVSRAAAAADLDGDGDLDLVALELDGPVRVLLQRGGAGEDRHWLAVRLEGRGKNRFGLGARVTVEAPAFTRSAEVRTAAGFQAAQPAEARFGLGPRGRLERVRVRWPSGAESLVEDVAADQVLVVREPERAVDGIDGAAGAEGEDGE